MTFFKCLVIIVPQVVYNSNIRLLCIVYQAKLKDLGLFKYHIITSNFFWTQALPPASLPYLFNQMKSFGETILLLKTSILFSFDQRKTTIAVKVFIIEVLINIPSDCVWNWMKLIQGDFRRPKYDDLQPKVDYVLDF